MNIYIGNLPVNATEMHVRDLFKTFGRITSVKILMDMESGQSKGFGFVEMDDHNDGKKAIKGLNNINFMDQFIQVSEAIAQKK